MQGEGPVKSRGKSTKRVDC